MNLGWNHILLACLLTVLEIYGTEAILSIPYTSRLSKNGDLASSPSAIPTTLATCHGGSPFLVQLDSYAKQPVLTFKRMRKLRTANTLPLFQAMRDDKIICSFHYNTNEHLVTRADARITIKASKKSKTGAEVEFVLQMDNVSEVINGIESNKFLTLFEDAERCILDLPDTIEFSMDYKFGTFPTKAGCCGNVFNRMWNFTPNGHMQSVALSCGPSSPVKVYCTDDRCTNIGYSTVVENSKNVMAYIVIDRNEKVRLVKGNKKKVPKDTFCTLYARNDDEVQFPLFGKNHINVAHVVDNVGQIDDASDFDDSPKIRSGRGFRLYTKSLKIESILQNYED